jgi:hypothetical protein
MNDKTWDLEDSQQYQKFYVAANRTEGRINRFLHIVAEHMNLPFKLTIYVFRRTAITHALIEDPSRIAIIAREAGTSVEMIEKHYANYLDIMESEFTTLSSMMAC